MKASPTASLFRAAARHDPAMTVRLRVARALPLLFFFGSATAAAPDWQRRLTKAESLGDSGKIEESVAAAQDALASAEKNLRPDAPEIGKLLASIGGLYELIGAETQFPELEKRLSAVKLKDFDVWFALGSILRREGKSLEAEDALKKALAFQPDDPGAEDELALVYQDMGRFEEEVRLLKERLKKKPQGSSLYSQLANAYIHLGRPTDAQKAFAQAKMSSNNKINQYIDEGYFYLSSSRPVRAREDFESVIALDPENSSGYHHMGTYFARNNHYPEAEKYLRLALKKLEADPNAQDDDFMHTIGWLGNVIAAQGRSAEAEALYQKGLKRARPGSARQIWLFQSLAKLYASQGKSAQAEESYKRAVDACGILFTCRFLDSGTPLIDLGQFYLSQGRRTEAEAMAERAEKYSDDLPVSRRLSGVLGDLAVFYAQLGDVSKEAATYARFMTMRRTMPFNPEFVPAETGLAVIDAAQGRFHAAEDHCRQAIEILDHNSDWKKEAAVLDDLAAIYEKEGQSPSAAREARERAKSLRARL